MERRTEGRGSRADRRRELRESKRRERKAAKRGAQTRRRFRAEQKEHALTLIASGGMTRERVAGLIGTTYPVAAPLGVGG